MAIKTYLTSDLDTVTLANSNVQVFGASGTQTVLIQNGVTGTTFDASIERIDLFGNMSTYKFVVVAGVGLQIQNAAGVVVGTVSSLNQNATVAFADGSAALVQTGAAGYTLGGTAVVVGATGAAAAVTPVTFNTAVVSGVGGGTTAAGQAFTLTTSATADSLVLTSGNDTVTGAAGTLAAGDIVIDTSSTDSDVMNLTMNAADVALALTPTISKVEALNVNFDVLSGAALNMASITGTTLTASSSKFGFNGALNLTNVAADKVVASTGVTNLTVAGLTTGAVNLGSATTASVTTAAATDSATITVNGNVTSLTAATTTKTLTVNATADTVLTLAANSATTIAGVPAAGKLITLKGDDVTVDGMTLTGIDTVNLSAATGATTDASKWGTAKIIASANLGTNNITHVSGAVVTVSTNQTAMTLTGASATTGTVDVTVGAGIGTLTSLTLATDKTAALKFSDALTVSTLNTSAVGTANIAIAGDTTISSLNAGTNAVVLTGTGNVTSTAASVAGTFDASALTGILTYTQTTDVSTTVKGGTGNNAIVFAGAAGKTSSYTDSGTAGNDTVTFVNTTGSLDATFAGGTNTVTAADLTSGTLAVSGGTGADTVTVGATGNMNAVTVITQLGEGNDVVSIAGASAGAGTFTLDFGNGTDTLKLASALDLTGETTTLTGLENIVMLGTTATVKASMVSGKAYTVAGTAGADTLTITGGATAQTIDTSTLNIGASVESVVINGGAAIDTIKGNGNDAIKGNAGADIITASVAGSDRIELTGTTGAGAALGGDTGAFAAAPATNTINTTTFDIYAGFALGDTIHVSGYTGAAGAALGLIANGAAANTLVGLTLTDNAVEVVRGTYTQSSNTFVGSATGTDSLVVYDSNATVGVAAIGHEAIVLVGYVAASVTGIGGAAGVITLA